MYLISETSTTSECSLPNPGDFYLGLTCQGLLMSNLYKSTSTFTLAGWFSVSRLPSPKIFSQMALVFICLKDYDQVRKLSQIYEWLLLLLHFFLHLLHNARHLDGVEEIPQIDAIWVFSLYRAFLCFFYCCHRIINLIFILGLIYIYLFV